MRFADITGNEEIKSDLRAMADSGKIPHALLISGPPGIGKMLMARAFISYINCEHPSNGDSCGLCPSCRRIDAGNNPDLHYIYPVCKSSSPRRSISADYAEQWRQMLKDSPYMDPAHWNTLLQVGNSQPTIYVDEADNISVQSAMSNYADKYKIFLIWLPEKMRTDTANKLLKLLEEPFADTLFICVSNEPGLILPTVYSRLRRLQMNAPSADQMTAALIRMGISPDRSASVARLAEGSMLKAVQIISSSGESEEFAGYFRNAMRYAYARKAESLKRLSEDLAMMGREKSLRALDYFARMTRENFIANLCSPPLNVMTPDEEDFSRKFAPFIHAANVEGIIREIDSARLDISRNANSKLVWFDFLLQLMLLLRAQRTG